MLFYIDSFKKSFKNKGEKEKLQNRTEMEKGAKGRRFSVRNPFCTPRTRSRSNRISPMSLLDRFREAVFRLIMISALSKATTTHGRKTEKSARTHKRSTSFQYNYAYEPHHSEAVADCIEFIKKSAVNEDQNRDSTASSAASDVVIPVPVM